MEKEIKSRMDIISSNPLFKYIKGLFTLIDKDKDSTVFINENGLLCKTNDICVKITGFINQTTVFESLQANMEYELCKLPGNIYRLTSIGFNEEKKHTYEAMDDCHIKGKYVCNIEPGEFGAISKIAINSRFCLKDSYAKSIEKFGDCSVYLSKNNYYIILQKNEVNSNIEVNYSKAYFAISLEDIQNEKRILREGLSAV